MPNINYYIGNAILKYKETSLNIDINENIIISANPRGGSTWLEQQFSKLPNSFSYYEPLNPSYSTFCSELNFSHRKFISEKDVDQNSFNLFKKLFSGKHLDHRGIFHPNSSNSLSKILFGKRIVYKFCRLNLLLPWIVKNFENLKIIVLIRNPFAQISSQLEFDSMIPSDWGSDRYNSEKFDFHIAYPDFEGYLKTLNKKEEILAAQWALNNKIIFEHPLSNKAWINLCYENLIQDSDFELNRIAQKLNLNSQIFSKSDLQKKSKTSISEVSISKWRTKLTENQVFNISKVLKNLDMYKYYLNEDSPVINFYFGEKR